MSQSTSYFTRSKFYSPVLNAAIFDGPFRIYFAQHQESLALKVYFSLQQKMKDVFQKAKDVYKQQGVNIFVMLYPTEEIYNNCFPLASDQKDSSGLFFDHIEDDFVIGVCVPLQDQDEKEYASVYHQIQSIVQSWNLKFEEA